MTSFFAPWSVIASARGVSLGTYVDAQWGKNMETSGKCDYRIVWPECQLLIFPGRGESKSSPPLGRAAGAGMASLPPLMSFTLTS